MMRWRCVLDVRKLLRKGMDTVCVASTHEQGVEASVKQLWHVGWQCVARLQVLQVLPKLSIILLFLCYILHYIHVQIHVLHTGHDIAKAAADTAIPSRRLTWQLLLLHICVTDA